MRLDQLTLTNFRGFESLDITFDPHLTVLLGGNMSGKTALLEGAAVALGEYFAGFADSGTWMRASERRVTEGEVRNVTQVIGGVAHLQPQPPVSISARATASGQVWGWTRTLPEDHAKGSIALHAASLHEHVKAGADVPLPVVALYGTSRVSIGNSR